MNQPQPAEAPQVQRQALPERFKNTLDDSVNKEEDWIVRGLLAEGEQMLVFGPPKVGKSHFVLQLAMSVALGKPFHNWAVHERGKVLYVNLEIGDRPFMRRIAGHYLVATRGVHSQEEHSQIGSELSGADNQPSIAPEFLREINEAIADHLVFSDGIREIGITKEHLEKKNEKEAQLLAQWHAIIDAIQPKLIIFDTLSKMHTIDERENNPIQQVIMLIRRISTLANESGDGRRKEVAHIVVHHARKKSENHQDSQQISLDSIRGASSIRAEADVIIGIGGAGSPTKERPIVPRIITIEARNRAGANARSSFDGLAFTLMTDFDPNSITDEFIEKVKKAFMGKSVRGIAIGELAQILSDEENPNHPEYKRAAALLKSYAARNEDTNLQYLSKSGNHALIAEYPVHPPVNRARGLYWIRDDSQWLDEGPIQKAIRKHKDKGARTPGKASDPAADSGDKPKRKAQPPKSGKRHRKAR